MKVIRSLALISLLAMAGNAFAADKVCKLEISGNDAMKFDKTEVSVAASCKSIEIKLTHTGKLPAASMGHNVVVVESANVQAVGQDGMKAGAAANFVGADDKFFYSIKPDKGGVRWKQRVGGRPAGPPAMDARRVYYVALDNILWAFDRGNGGRKWYEPLPVRPSGGPLVVGELVVVAGVAAEVLAHRADTGALAGKSSSPADLASAPQLVPSDSPALKTVPSMKTR